MKKGSSSSESDLLTILKKFDIYTQVDEDYRIQTSWGATVSIVGWIVMALLILGEVSSYTTPKMTEHLIVDTTLGQQLRININITFHALTCAEAHLDAMDVAGDNQLSMEHDMFKQRLSKEGKLIGEPGIEIVGVADAKHADLPVDFCGSCYGAESEKFRCCNTCGELKQAYKEKGWNSGGVVKNSTQCLRESEHHFLDAAKGEGCRVIGSMKVNKVAGNIHIAHGESIVRDGRHIHQFNPADAPSFNCSHTIHSLTFGDPYPRMPKNPLDKTSRMVTPDVGTGLFQYFIKIIPTIYTDENQYRLYTNQYTFTERFRPLSMPDPQNLQAQTNTILPGIFFVYDLSPFLVEVRRTREPLVHLIKQIFAIVGGVFTVMACVDGVLFKLNKMNGKKV